MINYIQIYGERCSGTNWLENLLKENMDTEVGFDYGYKHWVIDFDKLNNDVLYICILKNPYHWISSLFKQQHNLQKYNDILSFITKPFISYHQNGEKIKDEYFKNIFECRYRKINDFLRLKNIHNNVEIITYEYLLDNYNEFINNISEKYNIKKKSDIVKLINNYYTGGWKSKKRFNKNEYIRKNEYKTLFSDSILKKIKDNLNPEIEEKIFNYKINYE